ncbi:MAG: TIGR00282 family metallophosphoesterase [Verrucomicrobia bacterium]|nr:TIGR00282 family metallophosphoesterase [Verrucomicrobiota bacterium]
MRILCIGDIVGRPGREAVTRLVGMLRQEMGAECVVANAENAAAGSGITTKNVRELIAGGVDAITLGDHAWRQRDVFVAFDEFSTLLRPANYPSESPGRGACLVELDGGVQVGVINLVGRIFMDPSECPFKAADRAVSELSRSTRLIVVDMHAEATSEKVAMGRYLDGRVSVVFGTHTHVPTADETVLPNGTAYITDVGMTGPHDSVLGREVKPVLKKLTTGVPAKFEVATGDVRLSGALVTVDERTGLAAAIERVQVRLDTGGQC